MIATEIQKRSCCYLSTPEHLRSLAGQIIYIYTAKGTLQLSSQALLFLGDGTAVEIPLGAITDVQVRSYSFWAKPFGLLYIAVTYRGGAEDQTVLLTPTRAPGWCVTCWETNKIVATWVDALKEAMSKSPAKDV